MKCLRRRRISVNVHKIVVYTESDYTTMESIVSVLQGLRSLYDLIQIMNIIILKMWSVLVSKSLKVLLRDPSDENVTPVSEELKRRLKSMNANREDQREEKDSNVQNVIETTEEDVEGKSSYGDDLVLLRWTSITRKGRQYIESSNENRFETFHQLKNIQLTSINYVARIPKISTGVCRFLLMYYIFGDSDTNRASKVKSQYNLGYKYFMGRTFVSEVFLQMKNATEELKRFVWTSYNLLRRI